LSLRVFGDDITVAGRQASIGKKGKSKSNEDVAQETPVPEAETDTESAKSTHASGSGKQGSPMPELHNFG